MSIERLFVLVLSLTACSSNETPAIDVAGPAPTADSNAAPRGARHEQIAAAIRALTDRHACNRVTGCPGLVDLMQFGPELIAPATEALARPDRGDGHWTIVLPELLGQLRDPAASEPLVKLLGDKRWEIRIAAALGLAHLGALASPAALAALQRLSALPDNEPGAGGDLAFRAAVELALMRVDDAHSKEHRSTLGELMPTTREHVLGTPPPVLDAITAIIGHARLSEALPTVRHALTTGNRFVVATALDVVGKLQDNGAIPAVLPLLEDANPTLRKAAFQALTRISGASFDTAAQWRDWARRVGVQP